MLTKNIRIVMLLGILLGMLALSKNAPAYLPESGLAPPPPSESYAFNWAPRQPIATEYYATAHNLAFHGRYALTAPDSPAALRPPLYPLTLVPFIRLGLNPYTILAIQVTIFTALLVLLTAALGNSLAGRGVGVAAALLLALDPNHLHLASIFNAEGLFTILFTGSILAFANAVRRQHPIFLATSFALLGLATLARPTTLYAAPIYLIAWFLAAERPWRKTVWTAAAGILTLLLVWSPWLIRNAIRFPGVSPLVAFSTIGPLNLYYYNAASLRAATGNIPLAEARAQIVDEIRARSPIPFLTLREFNGFFDPTIHEPAVAAIGARVAREEILSSPLRYSFLHAGSSIGFFTASELRLGLRDLHLVPDRLITAVPNFTQAVITRDLPSIKKGFSILGPFWGALFILDTLIVLLAWIAIAVALITACRRGRNERALAIFFALLIAYFAATSAFIYEGARHRYGIFPLLIVLAISGARELIGVIRSRRMAAIARIPSA